MKILVLAGGFDQIALIQELKKRGHSVILADYYENPPAKPYADEHFQVSTLDENAILNLAKDREVQLITTACTDQALLTVARVSEKLKLPFYLDGATAEKVTNKSLMKTVLVENKIPTARSVIFRGEEEYRNFDMTGITYPVIVKPCDCNSSKGVVKVEGEVGFHKAVQNAFLLSRSKKVRVEDFMEGTEISVDAWNDGNNTTIVSISETRKMKVNDKLFTIYQSRYPVELSEIAQERIESIGNDICKAFDLRGCPLLIQAIVNGDSVKVIEFSARMGGGSKYKLIEYMSDINIMERYVDLVLGKGCAKLSPRRSTKSIELDYVYANNGTYKEIIGAKELTHLGEIQELFEYKTEGSEIKQKETSGDRIFGFLIEDDTEEALYKKRLHVIDSLDVIDVEGKSMIYRECFYQK